MNKDPTEIKTFCAFYKNVYLSDEDPDPDEILSFLNNLNLPQLDKETTDYLEMTKTLQEFHKALH